MFRFMTEASFQKAIREARNQGYRDYDLARQEDMRRSEEYIQERHRTLAKIESRIELIARDRLLEVLKDEVLPHLNTGISQATMQLVYEVEDAIDEENEQEKVSSAES